jgi:hypothetical protein
VSEASEPGIHNPSVSFGTKTLAQGVWIPGLRQVAHPGMTKREKGVSHVQPHSQKYSGSLLRQITSTFLVIPAHYKGAFRDRHERKAGMRWTLMALLTRALSCGRRSRVVLTPRRWRQVLERHASWERWWQQSPVTRESTEETVKTIACGNAGCPGELVVTNACAYYTSRTRLRVQRAPGIPHALCWARDSGTTRAQCVAGTRRRVCVPRMLRSTPPLGVMCC